MLVISSLLLSFKISILILPVVTLSLLQIDCVGNGFKDSECKNYISTYINAYTGTSNQNTGEFKHELPQQGYSAASLPQDTIYLYKNPTNHKWYNVTTQQVFMAMTVLRMGGIHDLDSTMIVDVEFNFKWIDERLAWNTSLTSFTEAEITTDKDYVFLEDKWIWKSDVILLNSPNGDLRELSQGEVTIRSNGEINWQPIGTIIGRCRLDISKFPFDSQSCPFNFASIENNILFGINLTLAYDLFPLKSLNFVDSIQYQTTDIRAHVQPTQIIAYDPNTMSSMVTIIVTVKRYSNYYYSTGIIPNILVCILCFVSLWINDFSARLGLLMTALLSIIAILWSTTSTMPKTPQLTWMEEFTYTCLAFVAFIAAETCLVWYVRARKDEPPYFFIFLKKCFKSLRQFFEQIFGLKCKDSSGTRRHRVLSLAVSSTATHPQKTQAIHNDVESRIQDVNDATHQDDDLQSDNKLVEECTWKDVAKGFDYVSRVITPLGYGLALLGLYLTL